MTDELETMMLEVEVMKTFTKAEFPTAFVDWLTTERAKAKSLILSMDYVESAAEMPCEDDDYCIKPTDTGFDCEAEFCFTVQYRSAM